MGTRIQLQTMLEELIGSKNVYFQPPENVQMQYPAIVYNLSDVDTKHANNLPYSQTDGYSLTVIDKDPDTEIRRKVGRLPMCAFERKAVVSRLHHFYFSLYY